jgi:hypothetical protein
MTTLTAILEEDFSMDIMSNGELRDAIEESCDQYHDMVPGSRNRKEIRNRINEMIEEYNDVRMGMKIYNHIK